MGNHGITDTSIHVLVKDVFNIGGLRSQTDNEKRFTTTYYTHTHQKSYLHPGDCSTRGLFPFSPCGFTQCALPGVCFTRCALPGVCFTRRVLYPACALPGVCSTRRVLYPACALPGVCFTQRVLYPACALGVCFTRCVLYPACALPGVSFTWCGLSNSELAVTCRIPRCDANL